MIRRLTVLAALAGALSLTAACGTDLPQGPITVNVDTSAITGGALHAGLLAAKFQPNPNNTEYTKGDVAILVANGKPTGVKYKGKDLQNCNPTEEKILISAATGALGGSEQDVINRFCGS